MTAEPEVKSAGANIQASAISTIVLGFAADPMARWVWPDSSQYLRIMPQFVKAFGGRAFENGTAYITEGARAAALWLPPGVQPDEAAMGAVMLTIQVLPQTESVSYRHSRKINEFSL